jgi:Zn-dependent protease
VVETPLLIACFAFFFMSIVVHEVAHGWVALRCGDPTARDLGRLRFNPLLHIDPFFSILLPILTYWGAGFFFGGAKPVPVNPARFRHPRRDEFLVSAAGPASNFLIAGVFAALMHVPFFGGRDPDNAATVLMGVTVILNLLLGVFNLIPIPPLDGSHILAVFLPRAVGNAYRRIGFLGILILLVIIYQGTGVWDFLLRVMLTMWEALGLEPQLFGGVWSRFQDLRSSIF